MSARRTSVAAVLLFSVLAVSAASAAESEPNDSCATADPAGASEIGSLGGADTQDWWSIEAAYGQLILVAMDPLGSNFDLELYDTSCSQRSGQYRPGTEGESTSEVANRAGRYYVRVILSSGGGAYELTVTIDDNEHTCEASALVAAAGRTESGSASTCDLPPMGDIVALFIVRVSSGPQGAPGGIVQAAIDGTGIACGPAVGTCTAAAMDRAGAGHTCRAATFTAAASVRLTCEARPAAP